MKTITAFLLTTIVYFLTFIFSAYLFTAITGQPIDLARNYSGIFIGACLLILPYIFNGLLSRKLFPNPLKGALITSLILVIGERLLIYLIGLLIVINGGDGPMDNRTVLQFIQAEAAPYYTLSYIIMGVLSIGVSVFAASGKSRHKNAGLIRVRQVKRVKSK